MTRYFWLLIIVLSGCGGADSPHQTAPPTAIMFHDSFERADTSPGDLGVSDSGHTWDVRGPYAGSFPLPLSSYGRIQNELFVADPASVAVYATQTFTRPVIRIGADVSWEASTGSLPSAFAMIVSANNNFITDMVHFVVSRSGWNLQVRESGGTFDTILSGSFSPVLSTGAVYTFEIVFNGDIAVVNAAGQSDSVTDPRISANLGPFAVWEHFYNSNPSLDLLRIHEVWAD